MARYENNLFNKDFFMDEKPVRRSRIHWHSYYEAEFCLGGMGTQRINGVCDTIEKGVLTFLSPKDFHSIEAIKPSVILFACYFCNKCRKCKNT